MNGEQVLAAFREAGALLDGHFLYASGRHGRQFLQAARVLQFPDIAERLCAAMASRFKDARIDLVVASHRRNILAYENGPASRMPRGIHEKNKTAPWPQTGFPARQGERVLVVEDTPRRRLDQEEIAIFASAALKWGGRFRPH